MISLKRKQSGFTIVELLIVIVVIGILAALVITTFAGVQKKARDTERETDIKAVHSQLEAYYANNGKYPGTTELTDAFATSDLKGLDLGALKAPKQTANSIVNSGGTVDNYVYTTTPASCDTNVSAALPDCTDYVLSALKEDGSTFTRDGLN